MVDIQTISIVLASASVIAGIVFYAFQIRHQTRIRKTDLIVRINPWFNLSPKELLENANILLALDYKDYDDFVQKHGSLYSGKPVANSVRLLLNWGDVIGMLLKRNLVDIDIVVDSYGGIVPPFYEKVKPLVEGYRKDTCNQHHYEQFEYLYNEVKKREQKLQQSKA